MRPKSPPHQGTGCPGTTAPILNRPPARSSIRSAQAPHTRRKLTCRAAIGRPGLPRHPFRRRSTWRRNLQRYGKDTVELRRRECPSWTSRGYAHPRLPITTPPASLPGRCGRLIANPSFPFLAAAPSPACMAGAEDSSGWARRAGGAVPPADQSIAPARQAGRGRYTETLVVAGARSRPRPGTCCWLAAIRAKPNPKWGLIDDTRNRRPSTAVGHAARSLGAHPAWSPWRAARRSLAGRQSDSREAFG
jgi:hypothetical protein